MGWQVITLENGEQHVIPIEDLRLHAASPGCWCHPFDDEGICVHNAFDKRELVERGEMARS